MRLTEETQTGATPTNARSTHATQTNATPASATQTIARTANVRPTNVRPTVVAVGGFASNSGKTSVVCELLGALPGWEAIKVSRGHYRSCGKDPRACCVAPLLGAEPTLRSGRAETYAPGKDTGRYWEAGASNVHWAVVSDAQVGAGVERVLARVSAPGVFVEGNSALRHAEVDFFLMVVRAGVEPKIKPTARRVLGRASAFYLFGAEAGDEEGARASFESWRERAEIGEHARSLRVYTRADLPELVARVRALHLAAVAAQGGA
jgi:hypothetical protein